MKRYAVKRNGRNKTVAILNYDEENKIYTIDVPENVSEKEAPFMISLFLQKGIRHVDSMEFQMGAEQGYSEQQAEYWRDLACERNAFL